MPARCFKDNCHISWEEVVGEFGPAYEGTLEIDGNSSLFCDEPTGGLNVKIAEPLENGNILTRDPDGTLRAVVPSAIHVAQVVASNFTAVPSSASSGAPAAAAINFTYDNDSGLEQLVVFRGQFQLHYDVLWEGNGTAESASMKRAGDIVTSDPPGAVPSRSLNAFNAQWVARLKRSLNGNPAVPVIADHFSTSGVAANIGENQFKSEWRNFTWIEAVANGGSINFQGDIFHDGPEQNLNISTSPAQQLDDNNANAPARGFRIANVDLYALPIRVE